MFGYLNVLIGGGLLVAGRKLFWLLVGGLGFMLGLELSSRLAFRSPWMLWVAALVLGVVFALLAVFVETVAIGAAGFLGGGLDSNEAGCARRPGCANCPDCKFRSRRRLGRRTDRLALQLGAHPDFVCRGCFVGDSRPCTHRPSAPTGLSRTISCRRARAMAEHAIRASSTCQASSANDLAEPGRPQAQP